MIPWNNTFLGKVFHKSKIAFILLLLFCTGQLFFTLKGVETVPFFNYGMFSEPYKDNPLTIYSVEINNENLDLSASSIHSGFIYTTIRRYDQLLKNNFNDPINDVIDARFKNQSTNAFIKSRISNSKNSQKEFKNWLANYFKNRLNIKVNTLKVKAKSYVSSQFATELVREEIIIDYAK